MLHGVWWERTEVQVGGMCCGGVVPYVWGRYLSISVCMYLSLELDRSTLSSEYTLYVLFVTGRREVL